MPVTSSKTRSVEHLGERAKVRQAGHGAPPTRVARAGYSIAQADAAGLWTECTKAKSGRAANDTMMIVARFTAKPGCALALQTALRWRCKAAVATLRAREPGESRSCERSRRKKRRWIRNGAIGGIDHGRWGGSGSPRGRPPEGSTDQLEVALRKQQCPELILGGSGSPRWSPPEGSPISWR